MPESKSGYIVCNERGPQAVGFYVFDAPAEGVLLLAHKGVTVFPTRPAARAAINRTRGYVKRAGLDWNIDYRIAALEAPPKPRTQKSKTARSWNYA